VSVNVGKSDTTNYVEVTTTAVRRIAMTGDSIILDTAMRDVPVRGNKAEPLFIIDGVRSTGAALKALDPKTILSVEVIKGALPMPQYDFEAGRSVVKIVTTAGAKR
jgi:hypothetical protein